MCSSTIHVRPRGGGGFCRDCGQRPDYVCTAGQLCQSVGNHTLLRSPCINCDTLAHHFCAEYWHEQNPVEPHLVITIKDLSKGGKQRLKNTPSAQKCNVMFCALCESRWKAIKVSAAAKIAAKNKSKRPLDKSSSTPSGQRAPIKKKKASTMTAPVAAGLYNHQGGEDESESSFRID